MAGGGETSPIINEIVANDKVKWYKKRNLRSLYLWLVPFAMFIESTSGFDSSMMNVRLPGYWQENLRSQDYSRVYKHLITGKMTSTTLRVPFSVFSYPATAWALSPPFPSSRSSPTGLAVAIPSSLAQLL
jgi:hypothetical protein